MIAFNAPRVTHWDAILHLLTFGSFLMNKFARFGLVSGAAALASVGSVFAAVPAEVTTAISDMKADGITVATAVLVAVIALAAIKFIRKGM